MLRIGHLLGKGGIEVREVHRTRDRCAKGRAGSLSGDGGHLLQSSLSRVAVREGKVRRAPGSGVCDEHLVKIQNTRTR